MKHWLWNPFHRIAGAGALLYGGLFLILTSVIAIGSRFHIDAVLHMGPAVPAPFYVYLTESLIAWLCTVIFFYLSGLIFSRSRIRLIDVAGTTAFARWPLLFMAILSFIPLPGDLEAMIKGDPEVMLPLLLLAFLGLPFIILFVVLLYQAYAVSCNLKGAKAIWTFILALLLSDILSRVLFGCLVQKVMLD